MPKPLNQLLARSVAAATISVGVLAGASGAFAAGSHSNARTSSTARTIQGTVVSDNYARHTLVVALHSGMVSTLRFASARHVAIGAQISSRASVLGDGTFRATTLNVHAKAHAVRLHATVVGTHGRLLELSSGSSVFSVLRPRLHSHDSTANPQIGEVVNVNADVQGGSIDETSLQDLSTSGMIGLEGVLTSLSSTSITLNVNEGATTSVSIPPSITLPSTIAVGDQVELLVAYANQAFTLVTIVDDQAAANNASTGVTESDQNSNSTLQIEGLVTAADATSLTIQPGDGAAAVVVAILSTLTVAPVAVGDRVHVVAEMVAGVLTLVRLDVQGPEGDQGQSMTTEAEGQVVTVSATLLVVQPSDAGTPVSFAVPSSLDVSTIAAGDQIHATGELSGSVLTLTHFEVQGQDG
jgi:hypothetical protein